MSQLCGLIQSGQGRLDRPAIQGWVANRCYDQTAIPRKDAAILSNRPDREVCRHWVQRILDHDGTQGNEGGIEAWLLRGEAVRLTREELWSHEHLLPGVRFAIDAYVSFTRQQPWEVAAGSSRTELFAPAIHQARLDNWPQRYPWIDERALNDPGRPLWLLAELTYKCPLQRPSCSNPLDIARDRDELSTDERVRVLREARTLGAVQLGFSGGEALVRRDLEMLIAAARDLGFYTKLSPGDPTRKSHVKCRLRDQSADQFPGSQGVPMRSHRSHRVSG